MTWNTEIATAYSEISSIYLMASKLLGIVNLLALITLVTAQTSWTQCGGQGWYGTTTCPPDFTCVKTNDRFSQCQPNDDPTTPNSLSNLSCPRTLTSTYTEVVFPHPVTCPPLTTTVTATPARRDAPDVCTTVTVVVHTVTVTATPSCIPTTSTVTITPTPFA